VIASALTLSMTVTNWMAGIFMAFVRFPWRKALALTIAALAVVLLLQCVQQLLFPSTQRVVTRRYIRNAFFQSRSGGPVNILEAFVFHAMVMPEIQESRRGKLNRLRLTIQHAVPGSGSWWGVGAIWLWSALLGLGAWAVATLRQQPHLRLVLGLTILGQLALHLVFCGNETFLFALHFGPLLVVLAAFSALTRARHLALGLAGALLVCTVVNNAAQFERAVQFVQRQATSSQSVQVDDARL
jgi:hypothetical protein